MNSFYRKKKRRRGTWSHPATKEHHLIDYVLMRSSQHCYCQDVGVVRVAECWTDHFMVRAKLALDFISPSMPDLLQ